MAIEFVEGASSSGGSGSADSSGCNGRARGGLLATGHSSGCGRSNGGASGIAHDLLLLEDDWATDEPDMLAFKTEADENMTAMWNMDSIDVASTFAGESSAGVVGVGGDALLDVTLTNWWEQNVEMESSSLKTKHEPPVPSMYPSMSPLAVPVKQQQTASQVAANNPDKEVTDALMAVFAPHAILSDDSQTDSGTESNSAHQFGELTLSRGNSPASSTSNFSTSSKGVKSFTEELNGSLLPPTARKKIGKAKTKAGTTGQSTKMIELADDEKDLTPLEIRRKRNRESMQRARRRQRDDVEEMKETLQELEQHYQKLSDAAQERRGIENERESQLSLRHDHKQRLEADYYAIADLSHTLKEEKFMLEQMITDKQKTYRRLKQVMVDRMQELELPCPTTTTPETLFSDFDYTPITEEQSNELIRQCYLQILQFQDASTPLTPPRGEPKAKFTPNPERAAGTMVTSNPFPPTATFGWKVSCHVTPEKDFFVSFAKYFKGVSAEEAMLSTWSRFSDPTKGRSPHRKLVRYELLQVINDSTYVAGVDIHHPVKKDKQMRNMFCRFRMQTEQGYVIGRSSVNPKSPELRKFLEDNSTFEYVDNYSWIEFTTVADKVTGEEGVCVKFNARTEYNTQEDTHLRLVNSLFLTLKWESAVIPNSQPSFFLPS